MRKQLSAPEYLEKRKLERERRKSFDNSIRGRLKKNNRKLTTPVTPNETAQYVCDCAEVSAERGIDVTCENCYTDLCSDCENEVTTKEKSVEEKCNCNNDDIHLSPEKCPECDRFLHFIDAGSTDRLERKQSCCKCSDFKSSQESVGREFTSFLHKNRGYHSSDNIVGYTENSKSKEDLSDTNNSCSNIRTIPKTCLKCAKIKENIVASDSVSTIHSRKSRYTESRKRMDTLRSKSKDDPQRSKLSKIGTWRRKSEPGLQQNAICLVPKKTNLENEKGHFLQGNEKIEFECRNCGSNIMTRKLRNSDRSFKVSGFKPAVEIKMYNSKNIPKKISKLKKNRAKSIRHGSDTTTKFYTDLSSDVSTENILHISESNDSLNILEKKDKDLIINRTGDLQQNLSKDDDIDEETYKKLIEKTDSFKKNELEKVKYLNKQKVINEGSEIESESRNKEVTESCEETEEPLEQIISQLLMQNREFQKLLKKQQQRNTAQRRHQRLLKSHSNPEPVIRNNEQLNTKSKYVRQTSENLDLTNFSDSKAPALSPPNEEQDSDDDHIYETLRVIPKVNNNEKNVPDVNVNESPKVVRSENNNFEHNIQESDYVYLSFNQLNKSNDEGIYDVPVKRKEVENVKKPTDYYVTVEQHGPRLDLIENKAKLENVYDKVGVCIREKQPISSTTGEYLPMSTEQSPNNPEIWLSRQKEHFNVSRDRKSGSLPRSFQIVTSNNEDQNLSSFRSKPNNNSKTYLNRDGKVLSIDRPFTIASDKSELSFDDVENYMSDGDILKFNKKKSKQGENVEDSIQNISQSTLELEEEIDRCYKNNFEKINLDANKNENILTASQSNLLASTTSSCEALMADKTKDNNDIEIILPEHKIYKPTGNVLSLKNVLNRFKNKNSNKNANNDNTEVNVKDTSSPDSTSSDLQSPTNEKRSALNPRSYSKNLLQRFRNIIGDEQTDDSLNRSDKKLKTEDLQHFSPVKNKINVVITSTETTSHSTNTSSSVTNDQLSRSVCIDTTLSESQSDKSKADMLSHSCDNINNEKTYFRPIYEKSISLGTNSSSVSTPSPSKSNNSAAQNFNKLPIYMQGSKHLGARIAQPDYVDPTTLINETKNSVGNVNVLINKNAVRPDSLFSNSSFITSSSEGTSVQVENTGSMSKTISENRPNSEYYSVPFSDENFYEKSFEKIEQLVDEDVFRDSAVYSDQDELDVSKNLSSLTDTKTVESVKRNSSFKKSETLTTVNTKLESKNSFRSRLIITGTKVQTEKVQFSSSSYVRPKIAPPVPVKPKIGANTITANDKTSKVSVKSTTEYDTTVDVNSTEHVTVKTIQRNNSIKQSYLRSASTPAPVDKSKSLSDTKQSSEICKSNKTPAENSNKVTKSEDSTKHRSSTDSGHTLKPPNSNIQMKRLSFERASLDSATRKIKTVNTIDSKRLSTETPKGTTKSVLERRMEIESMSRNLIQKPSNISKKPSQIAKPITTKLVSFERQTQEPTRKDMKQTNSTDLSNIPTDTDSITSKKETDKDPETECKESWVKQVVNKFQ